MADVDPWWSVDLESIYNVSKVVIYSNRHASEDGGSCKSTHAVFINDSIMILKQVLFVYNFLIFVTVYLLRDFQVGVTEISPVIEEPEPGKYNLCGKYVGMVELNGPPLTIECSEPIAGRYVVVQLLGFGKLRLDEVEVYGEVNGETNE